MSGTGKASAVFWLGLILIFLNFWVSGQSTMLWKGLTSPTKPGKPGGNTKVPGQTNPGGQAEPPGKDGKCKPGFFLVTLPSGRQACFRRPLGR